MFDWNAELEVAKQRIAELEEMVSRLREAIEQKADDATPIERILDRAQCTLSVRMASVERARFHVRFIEHKIQTGAKPSLRVAPQAVSYRLRLEGDRAASRARPEVRM